MTRRRCWTCNTDHDLDEACPNSGIARSRQEATGSVRDIFEDAEPVGGFGPVFMATYESECPSCDERILLGEDIRADGQGSYIHADTQCERRSA